MAKSTTEAIYYSRFQTAHGAYDWAFYWGEGMTLSALEKSDLENDIHNVGKEKLYSPHRFGPNRLAIEGVKSGVLERFRLTERP